jgi:hypothetical protein
MYSYPRTARKFTTPNVANFPAARHTVEQSYVRAMAIQSRSKRGAQNSPPPPFCLSDPDAAWHQIFPPAIVNPLNPPASVFAPKQSPPKIISPRNCLKPQRSLITNTFPTATNRNEAQQSAINPQSTATQRNQTAINRNLAQQTAGVP